MTAQPCQSVTTPSYSGREFPCQNNARETLCGVYLCGNHVKTWRRRLERGERIRIHPQRLIWDYSELSEQQAVVESKNESAKSGAAPSAEAPVDGPPQQRCRRCGETKPPADFYGSTGRKRSYCTVCNRAVALESWRRRHPPKSRDTFENYWADQGLPLGPALIEDRPALPPPPEQDARPPAGGRPGPSAAPAGTPDAEIDRLTDALASVAASYVDRTGLPVVPAGAGTSPPKGAASEAPAIPDRPLPQPTPQAGASPGPQVAPAGELMKAAAGSRAAKTPLPAPAETRASGVDDTRRGVSVPSARRSDTATASTPEARAGSRPHHAFVVHKPRRDAEVVTLEPEPPERSGRGTSWLCNHAPDQLGGIRCINCCIAKPQHYVELVARGGTPARRRWLCSACLSLFEADGRVAGHERRREVFAVPGYQDGYGAAASA